MKESWTWNEDDLQRLIDDRVTESIELDYKKFESLDNTNGNKTEISKDVSALANAKGGTIIYGIEEDKLIPTKIQGVDPKVVTKEWIDQVINSRISPRIDGVRINQIALPKNNPGKVCYVVHVPQGQRAHQAYDKKYYKRFNFESIAMDDYEIQDINRRATAPDLELLWEFDENVIFEDGEKNSNIIKFNASVINNAATPASHAVIKLIIDSNLIIEDFGGQIEKLKKDEIYTINERESFKARGYSALWSSMKKMPIFQTISFRLFDADSRCRIPKDMKRFILGWEIHTPGANVKRKFSVLSNENGRLFISNNQRDLVTN